MVLGELSAARVLTGVGGRWSVRFAALGTSCRIDFTAFSRGRAADFAEAAIAWVENFEKKYSRYRTDSLICQINAAAGSHWVAIDQDLEKMLALCDWFHWRTEGLFDPTMLPLTRLWNYADSSAQLPEETTVAEAFRMTGWEKVNRRPGEVFLAEQGMELDLGGIGKEYAVDCVSALAARAGVRDYLVDFGRDIRVAGQPPEGGGWKIGLEDPARANHCWGGVALDDLAVATSGNYLRCLEVGERRFGHILDPRQGRPAGGGADSASVVAETCVEAGVLSTAAVILGPKEGLALIGQSPHAAASIWSGGSRFETPNFRNYVI